MAAFYANENFPLPSVLTLRSLGHDVLTIQETGRAGAAAPDEEVLAFAASEQRILLTLNRKHFIRLHEAGAPHAGIVVCTFDRDFIALAQRIHELVTTQSEHAGVLLRVNRPA
jgi:hypothetical protein